MLRLLSAALLFTTATVLPAQGKGKPKAPAPAPAPAPTPAVYAGGEFNWAGCAGSSFNTCASVASFFNGSTLKFTVTNLGDNGQANAYASVLTHIGFSGLPQFAALPTFSYTGAGDFKASTDINPLSNFVGIFAGADAKGVKGLQVGESIDIMFSGFTGAPAWNSVRFGVHGQSGPSGCSTKFLVTSNSSGVESPTEVIGGHGALSSCVTPPPPPPPFIVPEPASLSLLAAGLLGLGAMARRRRAA